MTKNVKCLPKKLRLKLFVVFIHNLDTLPWVALKIHQAYFKNPQDIWNKLKKAYHLLKTT